ncbi:MAG: TIGR03905 family TSCPD domain-containing protein [Alistipes sp.]|nr:TIGR03905 family TSCPD domain-containing protein [Alistipes sp.]
MSQKVVYPTSGVCSQAIVVELDGDIVASVEFIGGCHGNTQGIAQLVKGMRVEDVISRLQGIDCRGKGTSCPDQLACALKSIVSE